MNAHAQIRFFRDSSRAPSDIRENAAGFLQRLMPQGAVVTAPTVFHENCSWSVALAEDGSVVGLVAQRILKTDHCTVGIVRGSYLEPELRGSRVTLALQAHLMWLTWLERPLTPLYWCTRTRNPAAYAAAQALRGLYPRLDDEAANRTAAPAAEMVARLAYGPGATLDAPTFVLRGSFPAGTIMLPLEATQAPPGPITDYFRRHLDYATDDNLFLMVRCGWRVLLDVGRRGLRPPVGRLPRVSRRAG